MKQRIFSHFQDYLIQYISQTGLKINLKLPLKSNNFEFLRYCGGHFENGDR
jgi:hypothetical protein